MLFNKETKNLDVFDFLELPDITNEDKKWNNKKKEFNLIFAYDHNARQYELGSEISELEFDAKGYIQNEINVINTYCLKTISIPFYIIVALIFAGIGIIFFLFYISLFTVTFFYWNPIIFILVLEVFIKYSFSIILFMFSSVNDKYRSIGLEQLINDKNINNRFPNISWSYGRDGSWIEVKGGY